MKIDQKVKSKQTLLKPVMVYFIILSLIVIFAGCSSKPQVIVKTQYQEVVVPVKCLTQMPLKPTYRVDDLNSATELAKYYNEVEILLQGCVNE